MGTGEDNQNFPIVTQLLPLRIGASHVTQELTTCGGRPAEEHWQMSCLRLLTIMSDQSRKAVGPNEVRQKFDIFNSEGRWNIHFR